MNAAQASVGNGPGGGRRGGGVNLAQASVWNVGTHDFDGKGETQMADP